LAGKSALTPPEYLAMTAQSREKSMSDSAEVPFAGRNALLFGGAKGIGKAVAREWARRGARLAIADIDETAAKKTAAEIEAAGGKAIGLAANVLNDESVVAAANQAEAALGEIDILLNNVGGMLNGHPEDIPFSEWHRMMDLNYFAAVRGVQVFLPKFLARGPKNGRRGHIVNTASFAGLYPYAASRIPYAAAKAAVISLSQNLAVYLEPQGIQVTCLIPGPVMTGVLDSMTSWTPDCPMRGPGSELSLMLPEDVAVELSDGMRDGRILIPSDPAAWGIVERWASSPDAFINGKIDDFARGEAGRPMLSDELRARLT
jgi:NAD(P)-dependent dehydrogenase (short-subunit alcohol dehydrogenase family)